MSTEAVIVEIRSAEGGLDSKMLVLDLFRIYGKAGERRAL